MDQVNNPSVFQSSQPEISDAYAFAQIAKAFFEPEPLYIAVQDAAWTLPEEQLPGIGIASDLTEPLPPPPVLAPSPGVWDVTKGETGRHLPSDVGPDVGFLTPNPTFELPQYGRVKTFANSVVSFFRKETDTTDTPETVTAPEQVISNPVVPAIDQQQAEQKTGRMRSRMFLRVAAIGTLATAVVFGGLNIRGSDAQESSIALIETTTTPTTTEAVITSTTPEATTSTTVSTTIPEAPSASTSTPEIPPSQVSPEDAPDTPVADVPQEVAVIGAAAGMIKIDSGDSVYNELQAFATGGDSGVVADNDPQVAQFVQLVKEKIAHEHNRTVPSLNIVHPGDTFQFTLPPEIARIQQDIQSRFKLFS